MTSVLNYAQPIAMQGASRVVEIVTDVWRDIMQFNALTCVQATVMVAVKGKQDIVRNVNWIILHRSVIVCVQATVRAVVI